MASGVLDVEKCVREHEWMEVNSHEIKVGDNLFSMTDAIMFDRKDEVGLEIISVEENSEMIVHNLSGIEGTHTFFANGMLVHNFIMEVTLGNKRRDKICHDYLQQQMDNNRTLLRVRLLTSRLL